MGSSNTIICYGFPSVGRQLPISAHTYAGRSLWKERQIQRILGLSPLPASLPEQHDSTTGSGIFSSHHYLCLLFQCHQLSKWMYDSLFSVILSPYLNVMWWCWIGQSYSSVNGHWIIVFWLITHALALQRVSARKYASSIWVFAACVHHSLTHYPRATCLGYIVCDRTGWSGSQLLCVCMRERKCAR